MKPLARSTRVNVLVQSLFNCINFEAVKRSIMNLLVGTLVGVMLLQMTFIVEIPQNNTFTIFLFEMNEVESEDSHRFDTDNADEFLETPFNWNQSGYSTLLNPMVFLKSDKESYICEIISPPPQVSM